MIWLPKLEHVLRFHTYLVQKTGGSDGVRELGLIESALMRASAGFGGYDIYRSTAQKAAAVCCGLIENHGFIDGNKRIGIAVMLLILKKNGCTLHYSQEELIQLGLGIAQGSIKTDAVTEWICVHSGGDGVSS